jgi:nitroreductase/dihydropteridine reductase
MAETSGLSSLGVLLSACADMGIDSTPMEGIEPKI